MTDAFKNGAGSVFAFLRKVEPGVVVLVGFAALGFLFNQNTSLKLMQRDIASINTRMSSEEYTPAGAISIKLHQAQMESAHRRIGEVEDEQRRVWDRMNRLTDQ